MRRSAFLPIVAALAMTAIATVASADQEPIPLYTGEDLDRMFGPVPAEPSDPVDRSRPEDWSWIEQFIDRQYSRIDADRAYDLQGRALDNAATRVAPRSSYYGGALAWRLRYPASVWWNTVAGHYAWSSGHADHPRGHEDRPRGGYIGGHGGGHGGEQGRGQAQGQGHGPRNK